MNVKNIFYDKMDLRLLYFDVAKCLRRISSFYEKRIKRIDTAED